MLQLPCVYSCSCSCLLMCLFMFLFAANDFPHSGHLIPLSINLIRASEISSERQRFYQSVRDQKQVSAISSWASEILRSVRDMYSRKKRAAKKLSLQSARTGSGWVQGREGEPFQNKVHGSTRRWGCRCSGRTPCPLSMACLHPYPPPAEVSG